MMFYVDLILFLIMALILIALIGDLFGPNDDDFGF